MKLMKRMLLLAVTLLVMCQISCDGNGKQSTAAASHEAATIEFTGDIDRDAEALVQRSVELSRQMLLGTDTEAESQQLQQSVSAAEDYYAARGQRDDFKNAFTEKLTRAVSDLAQELKKDSTAADH